MIIKEELYFENFINHTIEHLLPTLEVLYGDDVVIVMNDQASYHMVRSQNRDGAEDSGHHVTKKGFPKYKILDMINEIGMDVVTELKDIDGRVVPSTNFENSAGGKREDRGLKAEPMLLGFIDWLLGNWESKL